MSAGFLAGWRLTGHLGPTLVTAGVMVIVAAPLVALAWLVLSLWRSDRRLALLGAATLLIVIVGTVVARVG